jgi:hypothetical protein
MIAFVKPNCHSSCPRFEFSRVFNSYTCPDSFFSLTLAYFFDQFLGAGHTLVCFPTFDIEL